MGNPAPDLTRFRWRDVLTSGQFAPAPWFVALVAVATGVALPLPSALGSAVLVAAAFAVAVERVVLWVRAFRRERRRHRSALATAARRSGGGDSQ